MTGRATSTIHARLQLLKLHRSAREGARRAGLAQPELAKLEKYPVEYERVAKALGTATSTGAEAGAAADRPG